MDYGISDDKKLLQCLSGNDEQAFTELFNRYWRPLYITANNILENDAAVQDALQNVFISVWERRHTLEVDSFAAWLHQATRFQVLKILRSRKTEAAFQERLAHITTDILQDNPLLFKEHQQLLHQLINRLPEDCREVFRLSREEHLSYKEIAVCTGMAEKTVEKKISKSLAFFRNNRDYELCMLIAALYMYSRL